ncbi:MAG: protein kinase [Deltaproteobacteria bacterium]|nr:protein kinase [Deltaproteobacteria bacterium]
MRPEASTPDALVGQIVGGRYRILRRIGAGGMGAVYEGDHVELGKRVAIKFLLERYDDDPEAVTRFRREARIASQIGQANIVDVIDVGTDDSGRSFIVMELLSGMTLGEVLQRGGPMPAERAVAVIRQVLAGLGAAHDKGIVHRDMKPENVFVENRGDDGQDRVKIVDFGISKLIAANESKIRLTATGAVIGTPVYMAPEQAMGLVEVDHRVDLYAVGVMLFEMLAGRPPFQGTNYAALVSQHLHVAPPSLATLRPDVPRAVVEVVARALAKEPGDRFATAAEMARALPHPSSLRLDGGQTLGPGPHTPPAPLSIPLPTRATTTGRGRARWIAIGLAVGALAIGGVVVAVTSGSSKSPEASADTSTAPAPTRSTPPTPTVTPAPTSTLEVVTQPAGASVFVDDVRVGTSPIVLATIDVGSHQLRVEKDGFATVSMAKDVRPGRDEAVSIVLARATADAGSGSGRPIVRPPTSPTPPIRTGAAPAIGSGADHGSGARPPAGSNDPTPEPNPPHVTRPGEKANPYD